MYDRNAFVTAVKNRLEPNIFAHSLAVEACMGGLFDHFQDGSEKDDWLLAGLIHDIDYSGDFKPTHPTKIREVLSLDNLSINDTVLKIVQAHAPKLTGIEPTTKAEWSLFCCDSLTGLITAVALILPSKSLTDVKVSSVMKRFLKEPRFAAGTRRDEVILCEKPEGINLPLEQFITICLTSMQKAL
jgi:predicted hydrolase (HD superfamily)